MRGEAMTFDSVQVLPGPGIVARFGDVLLWMEEGEGGGKAIISRLFDLARALADGGDGRSAGRQVAEVLRSDSRAVPALVLVTPGDRSLRVIVHGWGRVLADGVDIDGGWVDRELPWTTMLAAGRGGDLLRVPKPGSALDLSRGSTPGGGAAVVLAPLPAEMAPPQVPATGPVPVPVTEAAPRPRPVEAAAGLMPLPEPAPALVLPSESTPPQSPPSDEGVVRVDLGAAPPPRVPLPVAGEEGGLPADGASVTVKGVLCSRGHLNSPIAAACPICGTAMDQVNRVLQDGVRPPLGALVLDDGTTYALDRDLVVGTDPATDPAVTGGRLRPITVADPGGQLAPAHAEIRLVGWDVVVVARAPTFVLATAAAQQWTPAPPGQPYAVPLGARLAMGQRTFVLA